MSQSTVMQSTKKVSVTLKLPQLQNLIKRDPEGYKEEFLMQKKHFESEVEIFKLRPTKGIYMCIIIQSFYHYHYHYYHFVMIIR